MPTGDSSPPNKRNTRPNAADGDPQGPLDQDVSRPPEPSDPDESVDFGSYVSSTVRSSAELFGTPARTAPSRSRPWRTNTPPAGQQPNDPAPAQPGPRTQRPARDLPASSPNRPRTYWRDSVSRGGAATEVDLDDDAGQRGSGGNGGRTGDLFPWKFPDDERTRRMIFAAIAFVLVAVLVLIWLLGRGDDNGDSPPSTATVESIIDAAPSATEADDDSSTPPGFIPFDDETPDPSPTEAVRRGGDNQRNLDDPGTPGATGSSDPLADIALGPVAKQCPDRCLVRVAGGGDLDQMMSTAGTRPSFVGDDWAWTVTTPEGIAWFEQNAETALVSTSTDTLSLYMAKVPDGDRSGARIEDIGTVLDSAGPWRLIEASSVPANVKPLTDWGYQVDKLAPAPPLDLSVNDEPTSIASIEIGSLMDDVNPDNIERSITDLVAMGSTDGSGVGTRYYTSAANMRAAEYLYRQLESYGLDVWYEDFLSWEGYLMVNVIGEVPGADESAVYGVMAHFDTISENLAVSPGADDNATGVAGSLEIARVLSGYRLNHPVRVVFVNVEEVGIVGSQEFATRANAQGTPYEGVFNLDAIGAARQYNYLVLNGTAETQWMTDLFVRINDAYGLGQSINAMSNDAIVADDNRLRENGIDSMMVTRELYGQSPYHHTPEDRIDTISLDGVITCSQLTLLSLASLVQA
ncbi:MAG: M28 family peptidase [Chloroflexia bacterium]|nr:M28 family peptidase [Chloroflexia bacterium]